MKKIEDLAAYIFIIAVSVLSLISILGIWDFFDRDVISKSIQTLGLLAVVAVIVLVGGKFMEGRSQQAGEVVPFVPSPAFKIIRQITVTILIVSASFLAILGVLAIWEVIDDKDVLYKSISSVAVLAFGAFVIVITSLEREGNRLMHKEGRGISGGAILLIAFLIYVFFSFFRFFW
jgi:hypothetical protein